MTLKKFTRVEALAAANAFVFDFGGRRGDHRYIYLLRVCLRNYLIGLVGFEPNGLLHCGDSPRSLNVARRFELLAICGKIREITGAGLAGELHQFISGCGSAW